MRPDQTTQSHGRYAERQGIFAAQQVCFEIGVVGVAEILRPQKDRVKTPAISLDTVFRTDTTDKVIPGKSRHAPL